VAVTTGALFDSSKPAQFQKFFVHLASRFRSDWRVLQRSNLRLFYAKFHFLNKRRQVTARKTRNPGAMELGVGDVIGVEYSRRL